MASSSPKILLLGATGVSGLQFIPIALAHRSHPYLTLYVRSRSKLSAETQSNPRVTIVEGSLDNLTALQTAMEGVTAVISLLGAYPSLSALIWRTKTTPIANSFPVIFTAMKAAGVKRILALSTPNFSSKGDRLDWGWSVYNTIPPATVPQGCAEMKAIGEQVSGQDSLEWTVFRVPMLNNGEEGLKVAAGDIGPGYEGTKALSRASMARWLLEELEERKFIHEMPALGNY